MGKVAYEHNGHGLMKRIILLRFILAQKWQPVPGPSQKSF